MSREKNTRAAIIKKVRASEHASTHGGSWKVAYADFVTALMALFLLLWLLAALKPSQKEEIALVFKDTAPKKTEGFVARPTYAAQDAKPGTPDLKLNGKDQRLMQETALRVKEIVAADPSLRKSAGISGDGAGVLLQVPSTLLFQGGTAAMRPEGERAMQCVVKVMKQCPVELVVRGHADDLEARGSQYPTKWEMSSARAVAALRYVQEVGGIPAKHLRATGYGDSRPLVPALNPESLALNRRVEFYYHVPGLATW